MKQITVTVAFSVLVPDDIDPEQVVTFIPTEDVVIQQVVQGKTVMNGEQLFVDLNTNRSQMTGGRVKGSFIPGQ